MEKPYLLPVSGRGGFDVLCGCGHRKAEHSVFDACHGCNTCADEVEDGHDHPFQRCGCHGFTDVAAIDWDALIASA